MGSPEGFDTRLGVSLVGRLVYERFEAGDPLTVPFCGPPEISVSSIIPLEMSVFGHDNLPKRDDSRYIPEGIYPLACIIPFRHQNREPGAAMILEVNRRGWLYGVRMRNVHQLNEIGRAVGSFCEFERI